MTDNSLTQALKTLAFVRIQQGRPGEAAALKREVLEAHRRKFGEESVWVRHQMNALGWALMDAGELTEAEALFHQVLERARRDAVRGDLDVLGTAARLAKLLNERGAYAERRRLSPDKRWRVITRPVWIARPSTPTC
ncbi:MAG: tetratricopeptide repeat protein [Phycisphaerae bacterium]|nr:tetratricopeptide repeat protein [Phycisphaerae bacterium]